MDVIAHEQFGCPEHGIVSDDDASFSDWRCPTCSVDLERVACVTVPSAAYQGAVERIAELEAEIVRLERDRSNLAKSALAHRQAGREEADAARGQ